MHRAIPFLVVVAACGCKKHQHGAVHPSPVVEEQEVEEVEPVPADPRVDPDPRGSARAPEDPPGAPPAGDPSACPAYRACCHAYASSLAQIQGMTPDSIQAMHEACAAIDQLVGTPSADEACQLALDGLRQAMDAMKSVPGYVVPGQCL